MELFTSPKILKVCLSVKGENESHSYSDLSNWLTIISLLISTFDLQVSCAVSRQAAFHRQKGSRVIISHFYSCTLSQKFSRGKL